MSNYRRFRVPGGTYFFTINLLERRSDLLVRHIDVLREAVRLTRLQRPFRIDGWVVLPDHMHMYPLSGIGRISPQGSSFTDDVHMIGSV